jgi:hypothetical protein
MLGTSVQVISILGLVLLGIMLILGIVLMAARRRDHGRAAVIGIVGCVVLLLGVVYNAVQGFLIELLDDVLDDLGIAYTVTTVVSLFISLVGTSLLIWAVVARRQAPSAGPGRPDQPQPHPQPHPQPQWGRQPQWGQAPQPPFQQHPGGQNPPHPQG